MTDSKQHSEQFEGALRIAREWIADREVRDTEGDLVASALIDLFEQLQAVEKERDYFRDRLPDFSAVQQAEFARAEELQEQLEAAQEELRENDRLVERAWRERNEETEKAKRAEEQLEAAQRQLNTEAGWTAYDLGRERKLKEQLEAAHDRYDELKIAKNEMRDELQEQLEIERQEASVDEEIITSLHAEIAGLKEQLEAAQQEASDMRRAAGGMSADLTHFAQENAHLEEQLEATQRELASSDAALHRQKESWERDVARGKRAEEQLKASRSALERIESFASTLTDRHTGFVHIRRMAVGELLVSNPAKMPSDA